VGASANGRAVLEGGMAPDGCGEGGDAGGGITTERLRGRGEGCSGGRGDPTTFLCGLRSDADDGGEEGRDTTVMDSSLRTEDRRGSGAVSSDEMGLDVTPEGARSDTGVTGSGIVWTFEDDGHCDCELV
jgi:hypothetical protein